MRWMLRYMRGTVRIKIRGNAAERFLNLLKQNNIDFWDVEKLDEEVYATILVKSFKKLIPLRRKLRVRIKMLYKKGFPFLKHKYRKRIGLVLGLVLFLVIINSLSNFIYSIEINGGSEETRAKVGRNLEEMGVKRGLSFKDKDFFVLSQQLVLNTNELSWASINKVGAKIFVNINERTIPQAVEDKKTPYNIIAAKDGKIKAIEALTGQRVVVIGEYVFKGDLLISAFVETKKEGLTQRIEHATGRVVAETETDITFFVPKNKTVKVQNSEPILKRYIGFDFLKIPLNFKKPDGMADKESYDKNLDLLYIELPVKIYTDKYTPYVESDFSFSKEDAEQNLEIQLKNHLSTAFLGSNVINVEKIFTEDGDRFILNVKITADERIEVLKAVETD